MVRELTGREIKRKYARSVLGIVWSVLNPLLYMIVMSLIFSNLFHSSVEKYPTYFLTAYILWNLFATSATTSMTTLVDNKNLLQKTKLPREIFVLSRDYTALVNFGFSLIAFLLVLLFYKIQISICVLFFPLVVLLEFGFSVGISFVLATIYVFHRDIKYFHSNIMVLLDHLIAMYYPIEALSGQARKLVEWNPLYSFIKVTRDCVLYARFPETKYMVLACVWGIGMFLLGIYIFKKNENRIVQRL